MSRPIYEPTPARYDAYNDYGNQQLFRRPSPESGATTSCDRAYMQQNDPQTISNATTTNLTNYETELDGNFINADTTTGKFFISATGIYLAQIVVVYDTTFTQGKMARLQTSGGEVLQGSQYWTNWVSEDDPGTNIDMVMCEALIFVTGVSTDVQLQGVTRQESGSPQDTLEVDFSIVRICEYDTLAS